MALVVLVSVPACGGSNGEPCQGECVADPEPHCIEAECKRDSQCPGGLRCASPDLAGVCRGDDDDGLRCRPSGPHTFNAFALRDGFGTSELKLEIDETAQPTLAWSAPSGVRLVSCAVFRCAPVFEITGHESIEGKSLTKIYNFDQCALIHRVMAADEGSFVLAMTGEEHNRDEAQPACEVERTATPGPVHTELTAGCWAYDTTRVVRASNLVRLRPDQVSGVMIPGAACGTSDDGEECYLEGTSSFGICLNAMCRPRCSTALDCELAAADPAVPPADAGPCGWSCVEAGQWRACRPEAP